MDQEGDLEFGFQEQTSPCPEIFFTPLNLCCLLMLLKQRLGRYSGSGFPKVLGVHLPCGLSSGEKMSYELQICLCIDSRGIE